MKDSVIDKMVEMNQAEAEFAVIAKEHRDRMKKLRTDGTELVMNIKREGVERMVPCLKVPEFDLGVMMFVEKETGRVVTYRKLMPNERQASIGHMQPKQ